MLKKFTVTNFKNFKDTVSFDLSKPSNYEFNDEIVRNNCLTKGMLYGINGSGKSNLALAIFDIVLHLTDKQKALEKYYLYLNLDSDKPTADFEYVFEFDGTEVVYRYSKKDSLTLISESVYIDGKEVLNYDYSTKSGYTRLAGTESMQLSSEIAGESDRLSRVKYIKSNALLQDNKENRAFTGFLNFVDNMLMFYSLDQKRFQGFILGAENYLQGIIEDGKTKEFEAFLHSHGVDYRLEEVNVNGIKELYCRFNYGTVPFSIVASTGTNALALFYYWYIKMSKASFVYVDEFDAIYHFELSQALVELVKPLEDVQIFFSTHNTDLLSNDLLRPDAYFLIKDNRITAFDKITDKELRRAHNMQKMYKAGTFSV